MAKVVRIFLVNADKARFRTGFRVAVFAAPTVEPVVGATLKQDWNQQFDANGMMTINLDGIAGVSVGTAVRVAIENDRNTVNGLYDALVEEV